MGYREAEFSNIIGGEAEFIPIIPDGDEQSLNDMEVPDVLPILPLRNTVLFPGVVIPITVGRQKSIQLIREYYNSNRIIGCLSQMDANIEEPEAKDLFTTGTVAQIVKLLEMPDGVFTVIIQGKRRFMVTEMLTSEPYFKARVSLLKEVVMTGYTAEFNAIIGSLKDLSLKVVQLSYNIPPEASFAIKNIENPVFLINFISSNSDLNTADKQKLLEIEDLQDRAVQLLEFLTREIQMLELKNEVQGKVRTEMDQQQREYFLHQQMKTIQEELGSNPIDQEIEEMKALAKDKKWDETVAEAFKKDIEKLQRINPAAPDYSIQSNYLRTLLELPWNEFTEDNFDLSNAQKILEEDHFGLEKVKDRILEHIAVLKLKGDLKSPILCLYGPPGVGKTSLGKSIARAINRNYIRMSLGGLHDESEIRGHRKTYIGAMPGRIIQNIKKTKSSNPVFILDEIDKVGNDFRGDPSSALLEVLDPEQNYAFHDNYLELDYDLSKVMFIATANTISTINVALRDRMEMIDVSGYIVEEKVEIAKRHLIPKQLEAHGVKSSQLTFSKKIIESVIINHTRESGVRELDKTIAKICRSAARRIAFNETFDKKISEELLYDILGPAKYLNDSYQGNEFAGVVTGLAWTAVGGQILFVETSLSKGKGNLTLTGNLGDVMKESAVIALEYLKAHSSLLDISPDVFEKWNVHVHVPEGAIPKDGPSAGITMVSSIASAFTQRKVKSNIAMTGEITLRGKVLPVGGIKEKILAAKRADIKEIILSKDNQKDIEQIKDIYLKGLTFRFVSTIMDVLEFALLKDKVEKAVVIE
ncbi:MAG: endopeptidase La [Bacteroidales bacterium]|nr:endopeptidase La [Bacteroidales bacterium]MCF8455092.1 endopeptidase La [Bacteroidales bacterium]